MSFIFKKSRDLMLDKKISYKNLKKLVNCTSLENRIINKWPKKIWNKLNRQNKRSKWNKSEILYPI